MLNSILRQSRLAVMVVLFSIPGTSTIFAADFQWSVSIADEIKQVLTSPDARQGSIAPDYPRAFLWIPPHCKQVKAIVLAQNNMEEESILEDANFRKTMSDLGFAEIWVTPNMGSIHFRFDQGQDKILDKMLRDLADVSGYQEIAFAPLVPIGHSAMASFGWDVAAWNPGRTLAVLSISGQWPYFGDVGTNVNWRPDWGGKTIDGVPGLITKGEYEIGGDTNGWYFNLKGDSLKKHPQTVLTQVVEPGAGHFDATDDKIALICLYLRKAAQYRLPADAPTDGPPTLTPIDPTKAGWLFDIWHLKSGPTAPAAPVADYQGNKDEAFWAFDEEMAKAIEDFQSKFQGKANVLIGYKQKDGLTPPQPDHGMVHLKFEPQDDGVTFKLTGGFWDTVPPTAGGKGAEWNSWLGEGNPVNQGDPISHPKGADSQIVISRITGPVVQTAPDTFVIHPYRIGTRDVRKSNDIWLAATFPGDGTYKRMVQQAELQFPLTNHDGDSQTITFPDIPDQPAGAGSIKLAATATSNAPVSYYIREGPAEVAQDGTLKLLPIPPRAKYPVKVTVVATQWGRSIEPKLQTADPVEKTFSITAPGPGQTQPISPGRADAPIATVTVTRKAPIELVGPDGEVSGVVGATVGTHYTLVRIQGSKVLLQDASGARYLIPLSCTDCPPPPPQASAIVPTPDLRIVASATPAPQPVPGVDPGPQFIIPGEIWPDDRGRHIQAHGGGIIKFGDTYYWYGEDYSADNPPGIRIISCYASKDLAHWQFRNQVEKADDPAHLGAGWILERPKVFYNAKTNKFVMYAHIDDKHYGYAHVAVFTCDTPDGDFQYLTNFRPLDQESRDIGQFIDDDGIAYLIFESRPTKGFYIAKLSDDYLSVEKQTSFIQAPLEGGALVHYDGLYYIIGSHMTGWSPNPNVYATAAKIEGPWTEFRDVAPPEKNTYQAQSSFLLKVVGSKTTSVIFMADWWVHTDHPIKLADARYIWMPLEIGDGKLWVPEPKEWAIDVMTGEADAISQDTAVAK